MTKRGVIQVEKGDVSPAIRAQMGGHPPIVMYEVEDGKK